MAEKQRTDKERAELEEVHALQGTEPQEVMAEKQGTDKERAELEEMNAFQGTQTQQLTARKQGDDEEKADLEEENASITSRTQGQMEDRAYIKLQQDVINAIKCTIQKAHDKVLQHGALIEHFESRVDTIACQVRQIHAQLDAISLQRDSRDNDDAEQNENLSRQLRVLKQKVTDGQAELDKLLKMQVKRQETHKMFRGSMKTIKELLCIISQPQQSSSISSTQHS